MVLLIKTRRRLLFPVAATALLLSFFGFSVQATAAEASASTNLNHPWRPDFSGSWEKDFQRSDRWENELTRQISLIRQPRSQPTMQRPTANIPLGGPSRRDSSIIDLARLAELISRQNVIDITQTENEVFIAREGDAALICGTRENSMQSFSSPYGTEVCGWERQQLVFRITLPEEVQILHRFSLSPDREWLNHLTTVSRQGSVPFNLIQVYRRFDMPGDGYNCTQTLTRGRVCSTESKLDAE
ncbi:MAG: hypothetical protein RQ757_05910 [Pseudomonadales bacterium]|nr:hypothetical protein [Pseudomonadales bacterium]